MSPLTIDPDLEQRLTAPRWSVTTLVEPLRTYGVNALEHALTTCGQKGLATPDALGWTVLMALLAMPNAEDPLHDQRLIEGLLDVGVPPGAIALDGTSALLLAAVAGNEAVVARLLDLGVVAHNVRHQAAHPRRTTALHEAVGTSPGVVQRLLDAGADPGARNLDGHTPLRLAVWANRADVVAVLVHAGSPVNRTQEGVDLLHDAMAQNPRIAARLMAYGADPHALDSSHGGSLLHTLARAPITPLARTDLMRQVLAQGVDPNRPNAAGQTPLHELVTHGARLDWRSLFALVRGGADLTRAGGTPESPQQPAGEWLYERCVVDPFRRNDVDARRLHRLMELFEVVRAAHEVPATVPAPASRARRRL